jgi:hypothetical protein
MVWQSIHDDSPIICDICGSRTTNIVEKVNTYAIGTRGNHTRISDATDREWHKDMDAYKRFHDAGIQPHQITGCDRMESTAISRSHVESGGALPYSDERIAAGTEEARQIMREATVE